MPNRSTFFHHLHPVMLPARESRFRYTFGLGGLSVFLFVVLALTGALELFYYIPSLDAANKSVQTITFFVPYGWLIRGLHYWAAQALVVIVILHLLRVTFTGSYKAPRRFNWLLGMSLLAAVLLLDFTGYALKWDSDIAWALLVGTNLLKSIPLIGSGLYGALVGGQEIGPDTVVRFYGWHIFGLALIAFCVIAWHIFRVRRDGGISHEPDRSNNLPAVEVIARPARISRNVLVQREALAMLIATIVLLALTLFFPPAIVGQVNFAQSPVEATAPWFFVWIQQLLRWGDPFVMGVLLPIGLLILLALIPYLIDRSQTGAARWFNREGRLAQVVVVLIVVLMVSLTIVGALQ